MIDVVTVAGRTTDTAKVSVKKNKRRGKRGTSGIEKSGFPPQYKVVVRKLPTRDFVQGRFEECLQRACNQLTGVDEVARVTVRAFIDGNHTREHGNLPGTGFLIFSDALLVKEFLSRVPFQVPFLQQDEFNLQPEVGFALYQKRAPGCEQNDSNKFSSQFATDPEFIAWKAQGDETKPLQAVKGAPKSDPKDSALLSFMRERALRRIAEKKGGRAKSSVTDVENMIKSSFSKGRSKGGREKVVAEKKTDQSSRKDKKRRGSMSGSATQTQSPELPPEAVMGVNLDLKDNIQKSLAAFREQQGAEASSGRRGRRGKGEGGTQPQVKLVSKGEALPQQR